MIKKPHWPMRPVKALSDIVRYLLDQRANYTDITHDHKNIVQIVYAENWDETEMIDFFSTRWYLAPLLVDVWVDEDNKNQRGN